MLSENRKFDFIGSLTIQRSRVLAENSTPKDDVVNWLFCRVGNHRYSFVYKIEKPAEAEYSRPFTVQVAFTMSEAIGNIVELEREYEVSRGLEVIGEISLISRMGS
jgi:hypothetical protein